jgi:hypothetical protein
MVEWPDRSHSSVKGTWQIICFFILLDWC